MKNGPQLEAEINSQYSKRFEMFGPTAKGVFWASSERQETRFNIILKEIKKISRNHIVLEIADIGCGYGSFANYLNSNFNKSEFSYEGFDINPDFIEYCHRQFSEANIRFIIGRKPSSKKNFITMSGTYNLATTKDVSLWEQYVFNCLSECWAYTKTAMIFNLQTSKTSKISSQNIYYANAKKVIDFCVSKLGPTRLVKENSLENDITFTVFR